MKLFTNAKLVGAGYDPDMYHCQPEGVPRGDHRFVMSRSELMLFAANPARWIAGFKPKETDATEWGSLIDIMVLDPAHFEDKVAVQPSTYYNEKEGEDKPWSGNATFCKQWKKDHQDMLIVTAQDHGEAKFAISRLFQDAQVARLIHTSQKQVYCTAEYHDRKTGIVIPVKTLIDLVPKVDGEFGKTLADFKTARQAAPRAWSKAVFDRGYDAQAAINLDIYVAATGEDRCEFRHIIQENTHPFQPARRYISEEYVDIGRMKVEAALRLYALCLEEDSWPSWDDQGRERVNGWTITKPEEWMIRASMESMFVPDETEEEEPESEDVPS